MWSSETLRQRIRERPGRAGWYAFAGLSGIAALLFSADFLLQPDSFPVRSMRFEGEFRRVSEQELATAVVDVVRGNFFLLDLDRVRARIEDVPWVHRASVRREWPDGVHIRFTEQELVARWGKGGWVNADGEHVDLRGRDGPVGLPKLAGPDGMQARLLEHYQRLDGILLGAGRRIGSLTLTARHSWSIVLDNGLVLTLGREAPEPKVTRFARVYAQALAAQATRMRRVDLRYTNGFSVEWSGRATAQEQDIVVTGLNEG